MVGRSETAKVNVETASAGFPASSNCFPFNNARGPGGPPAGPATAAPQGHLHNPLQLLEPQWQVERWDFDASLQAFTCVATTWLR